MSATYWIEISGLAALTAEPRFKDMGVDVLQKLRPSYPGSPAIEFWRVSDPGAPEDLEGKQVELTFEQYMTTPDTGDAPTMDVILYKTRIVERKAVC